MTASIHVPFTDSDCVNELNIAGYLFSNHMYVILILTLYECAFNILHESMFRSSLPRKLCWRQLRTTVTRSKRSLAVPRHSTTCV